MSEDDYIRDRVDGQIAFFMARARYNKVRFEAIQMTVIISGVLIPFLNAASYLPEQKIIASSILGTIVAILTGINQFKKYETAWQENVGKAELLRREKFLFNSGAGHYMYVSDY
jgi:uncharacterized membrane protein